MAIYRPGERFRYHRLLSKRQGGKRSVVALLSLTAMVDMFTVLVVFLLQNFSGEEQMLQLHKDIRLPEARSIKELKPAFVVTLSHKELLVDKDVVADVEAVKASEDWMIQPLFERVQVALEQSRAESEAGLQRQIRDVVQQTRGEEKDPNDWNKVTIQADKAIDILTVKKVMFTLTEAGAGEINFAVLKETEKTTN